jgi:hypothetical protein|tara:strand:+ start:664 stop:942 length:279 start_codon:yes stop_codon:yes gene_type:complete
MSDKKRKVPKTLVPEATHGAGKAGKYKINSQGAKGISHHGIVQSTVRGLQNKETAPPKRRKGWKAKGDAAMLRHIENELNKGSSPSRRNRNR